MAVYILVNSLSGGGAELQAAQLAAKLHAKIIITDGNISERAPQNLTIQLLKARPKFLPAQAGILFIKSYAKELAKFIKAQDIVLSFMPKANFINAASAKITGHKAILGEITQPSREYTGLRGFIMKPLIKNYYKRAALIVANSKGNALDLTENFGIEKENIKVIYNSCDIAGIKNLAMETMQENITDFFRNPVIVTAGRLTKAKGQWHLIRIFSELKKHIPEAKLVILGDGELKQSLVDLAHKLSLKTSSCFNKNNNADIIFTGFVKNPFQFIKKAKVFAFTSLWEGLPNALIEAIACGVPVIASDCASGPREILAPKTNFYIRAKQSEPCYGGRLMPPFSVKEFDYSNTNLSTLEENWAKELAQMLQNNDYLSECSSAGLMRAMDFSIEQQIKYWNSLISSFTK